MKKYLIVLTVVSNFLLLFSTLVESSPLTLDWQDLVPNKGLGEPILVTSDQQIFGLPDRKTFDGDDDDYAFLVESMVTLKYQQPPGAYIKPELDGKIGRAHV